jgi:hypothetical protein
MSLIFDSFDFPEGFGPRSSICGLRGRKTGGINLLAYVILIFDKNKGKTLQHNFSVKQKLFVVCSQSLFKARLFAISSGRLQLLRIM